MRQRLIFLTIIGWVALAAQAQQPRWSQVYQQYFDQYRDVAVEQMQRYGIPASITLAQGVLESGAGRSELTRRGNNHFGIKCHNGWTGPTTYHDDDAAGECFRAYANARESYEDHSKFLRNGQRYRSLFQLKRTDYKGWARGLKAAGYATNPRYADQLIDIIELYGLHALDDGRTWGGSTTTDYDVYAFNRNYYVKARRGDTFRSIAEVTGTSYKALARYNERERDDRLEEGEIVWLKKKRTKAPKEYKNRPHVVAPGESMYSIAQYYGIRLKSLYKLNGLSPDYEICVGDKLVIR